MAKTILIGKDPAQGKLKICLQIGGKCGEAVIGTPGSVPQSVSRCKPADNTAHCKIDVAGNGSMIITNLKPLNVTNVDGFDISSKSLRPTSVVTLGKDKFPVDVQEVLRVAAVIEKKIGGGSPPPPPPPQRPTPPPTTKVFNIKHLEGVYNDFKAKQAEIRNKQRRINLIRTACPIFTIGAMFLIRVLGNWGLAFTAIGLLGSIYSFIGMKNDKSAEKLDKLSEDYQDRYVCPNPDCNKYLGNWSYKMLKKQYNMHCPHCKCQYVEK
ncbi:MAG: FHA domain-containing protein [Prevotellaceae bacterium]|nr:FHA domain-containing protein [Prevotellaceae bacterium]